MLRNLYVVYACDKNTGKMVDNYTEFDPTTSGASIQATIGAFSSHLRQRYPNTYTGVCMFLCNTDDYEPRNAYNNWKSDWLDQWDYEE